MIFMVVEIFMCDWCDKLSVEVPYEILMTNVND